MSNHYNFELVAAIDFGTTYSGYAYSYRYDQDNIFVNSSWPSGNQTCKEATAILFNEKRQFVAFGGDAISKYSDLSGLPEENTYYFFNRFKMQLYSKNKESPKDINRNMTLNDATNKKTMLGIIVFSEAIRFLKNHLIESVNKRSAGNRITVEKVRWVLTVPAIWTEDAKQFMREAAEKAGIPEDCLLISLEPECASLYCKSLPEEKLASSSSFKKIGAKYLVLDNGGGTVDVTVHQILEHDKVREMYKATGGAWGGTKVDEQFFEFLSSIFSKKVIDILKRDHSPEWISLVEDFERVKRSISEEEDDGEDYARLILDSCFGEVYEEEFDVNLQTAFKNNVSRQGTQLRGKKRLHIPKKVISDMIEKVAKNISSHANYLLREIGHERINFIVMVGGFSNSPIVVQEVERAVQRIASVLVPEEAELAVVRGAVRFGWTPDAIATRKSKMTYGIAVSRPFLEGIHPERLAFHDDEGKKMCNKTFDQLIGVNEEIQLNESVSRSYRPTYYDQTEVQIQIFSTELNSVSYTDEYGVKELGHVYVLMPDTTRQKEREVKVDVMFGATEFKVTAKDVTTGRSFDAKFDFISSDK